MSKVKKSEGAPCGGGSLPAGLAMQAYVAFLRYQKFRLSLLDTETDIDVLLDLMGREDAMEAALILELEKVWREWTGRKAGTVGTGAGKLAQGEFPFGDWVDGLFKEKGAVPPSRYAIHKALKSRPTRLTKPIRS